MWQHHNNNGWTQFDRGDYVKAAERFDLAIKEIRPYEKVDRRLLARSYCDFARALIIRDALPKPSHSQNGRSPVRDEDKKAKPESVFQCVYVLAMVHKVQKHYADAETLLKRALAASGGAHGLRPHRYRDDTRSTGDSLQRARQVRRGVAPLPARSAIYEKMNPDENLDLADAAERFSALLEKMHRPVEAERWKERALKIRDTVATKTAKARPCERRRNSSRSGRL